MALRKILSFFAFLLDVASADNITVEFPTFTLRNLTLLGDTHLHSGVAGLTRELGVPTSSSGALIYDHPLLFYNQDSNTTASFSTRFTFSITNANPSSFSDGLAFFLSPDNRALGSTDEYLGLINSSQLTKNRFVTVEFDTKLDPHFNDPNENHVGLDVDSLISVETADAMSQGIDFKM